MGGHGWFAYPVMPFDFLSPKDIFKLSFDL